VKFSLKYVLRLRFDLVSTHCLMDHSDFRIWMIHAVVACVGKQGRQKPQMPLGIKRVSRCTLLLSYMGKVAYFAVCSGIGEILSVWHLQLQSLWQAMECNKQRNFSSHARAQIAGRLKLRVKPWTRSQTPKYGFTLSQVVRVDSLTPIFCLLSISSLQLIRNDNV
jgi:hypothetical protein